jgi:hypothetical protein
VRCGSLPQKSTVGGRDVGAPEARAKARAVVIVRLATLALLHILSSRRDGVSRQPMAGAHEKLVGDSPMAGAHEKLVEEVTEFAVLLWT